MGEGARGPGVGRQGRRWAREGVEGRRGEGSEAGTAEPGVQGRSGMGGEAKAGTPRGPGSHSCFPPWGPRAAGPVSAAPHPRPTSPGWSPCVPTPAGPEFKEEQLHASTMSRQRSSPAPEQPAPAERAAKTPAPQEGGRVGGAAPKAHRAWPPEPFPAEAEGAPCVAVLLGSRAPPSRPELPLLDGATPGRTIVLPSLLPHLPPP